MTIGALDNLILLQTSMSGIAVTEDAVNLYYYMKAKSVVCAILTSSTTTLPKSRVAKFGHLTLFYACSTDGHCGS